MMWRSVRISSERYEQVAALARDEGRSAANMLDRLLVRGLAVPGGRDEERASLVTGAGAKASTGRPDVQAPVTSDEPPPLSLPVFGAGGDLPPKPAKTAAEVAAAIPGVSLAHSLAGPAKPLSKQEQAGRKK